MNGGQGPNRRPALVSGGRMPKMNGPGRCPAGSARRLDLSAMPGPFFGFTVSTSGRGWLRPEDDTAPRRLSRFEMGTIVHPVIFHSIPSTRLIQSNPTRLAALGGFKVRDVRCPGFRAGSGQGWRCGSTAGRFSVGSGVALASISHDWGRASFHLGGVLRVCPVQGGKGGGRERLRLVEASPER